jgi:hypothetical protein
MNATAVASERSSPSVMNSINELVAESGTVDWLDPKLGSGGISKKQDRVTQKSRNLMARDRSEHMNGGKYRRERC